MIARTNATPAVPTNGSGKNDRGGTTNGLAKSYRVGPTVTKCITFERDALSDLQELAWAHNVPLDAMVREAVDAYRRG